MCKKEMYITRFDVEKPTSSSLFEIDINYRCNCRIGNEGKIYYKTQDEIDNFIYQIINKMKRNV